MKELELMRQWCLHSCKSMHRPDTLDSKIFVGYATDLALNHGFLMDIILAVSATQIAAETASDQIRASYTSLALEYQNSAVAAARDQLLHVNADNCSALFTFTVLNIPTSVVLAQLPIGGQDTARSPKESILISSEWIMALVTLMTAGEEWLRAGPYREAFDKCDDPSAYDDTMRAPMHRLTAILACSKYAGRDYIEQFRMFSHAVELLEENFVRSKTMSIAWLAEIGEKFVQHMDLGNQMALLITMHWGVLLHSLSMWWASFTGKRLVDEISSDLNKKALTPDEIESIQWARVQVGLDIQKTWSS
jgi:hypothetical protein